MPVTPRDVPMMNEERQAALKEAFAQIDQEILNNAGRDPHEVFIEYLGKTKGLYKQWFFEELVRQYTEAGWKYVTVFWSYMRGSHSSWESYLYLSITKEFIAVKGIRHPYEINTAHIAGK